MGFRGGASRAFFGFLGGGGGGGGGGLGVFFFFLGGGGVGGWVGGFFGLFFLGGGGGYGGLGRVHFGSTGLSRRQVSIGCGAAPKLGMFPEY